MEEGAIITDLALQIDSGVSNWCPSLVEIRIGDSPSDLKLLSTVSLSPAGNERCDLVTQTCMAHQVVQIHIKENNGGCDCKVHGVFMRGYIGTLSDASSDEDTVKLSRLLVSEQVLIGALNEPGCFQRLTTFARLKLICQVTMQQSSPWRSKLLRLLSCILRRVTMRPSMTLCFAPLMQAYAARLDSDKTKKDRENGLEDLAFLECAMEWTRRQAERAEDSFQGVTVGGWKELGQGYLVSSAHPLLVSSTPIPSVPMTDIEDVNTSSVAWAPTMESNDYKEAKEAQVEHSLDTSGSTLLPVHLEGAGGSKGSRCNGVYEPSGTHNDKPLYVQKEGAGKIYFQGYWKVTDSGGTDGWIYGVDSEEGKGALPPTTWRNDGYSGSDARPCPTLVFKSSLAPLGQVSFVDAEGDESTLKFDAQNKKLSWHCKGKCYLDRIGILEYRPDDRAICAPEHSALVARLVQPGPGPEQDKLVSAIVTMARASTGVQLRGFPSATESEGAAAGQGRYMAISRMPQYDNYSFEELRVGDYMSGRKVRADTEIQTANTTNASQTGAAGGSEEEGPAMCDVAGCSRVTWNGKPAEQCCRTCKASGAANHGPECNSKAEKLGTLQQMGFPLQMCVEAAAKHASVEDAIEYLLSEKSKKPLSDHSAPPATAPQVFFFACCLI